MTRTHLLDVAHEVIDVAVDRFRVHDAGQLISKGDRDYASQVDYLIERQVREHLAKRTPDIDFIGEENGPRTSSAERWWVLDPVDGTVNFTRGLPLCAISLALIEHEHPVLGLIDLPFLGARYSAIEGGGAACNGARIRVSSTRHLKNAVVSLGDYAVGSNADAQNERQLHLTRLIAREALRVRMLGSAAIDLAWVAHGKADACIMLTNHPWDVSAGVIIAREAGADVVDLDGAPHSPTSSATIAINRGITHELLELLGSLRFPGKADTAT